MPTLELARSAVDRRRQSLVKLYCCFGGAASRPRAESINVGRRSSCCCRRRRRRERSADQTQDTSTRDNALNKARNWVGDSRLLILWPPTAGRSEPASQPTADQIERESRKQRVEIARRNKTHSIQIHDLRVCLCWLAREDNFLVRRLRFTTTTTRSRSPDWRHFGCFALARSGAAKSQQEPDSSTLARKTIHPISHDLVGCSPRIVVVEQPTPRLLNWCVTSAGIESGCVWLSVYRQTTERDEMRRKSSPHAE